MEDYESTGDDNETYVFVKSIVERCKNILDNKKFVRIGYVVLDEMKQQPSKYILFWVLSELEETGKYQSKYIRHKNGRDDFLVTKVPKKSWQERNWIVAESIKFAIGFALGIIFGEIINI